MQNLTVQLRSIITACKNQQMTMLNQRDNETKILVAEIQAQAKIEAR